jgi:hypothetical protein
MSHALKTNVLNIKPNVSQLEKGCLAPQGQISHTPRTCPTSLRQMSWSFKPNVMHSEDKCPTPLRQMSYTLKTMTLGQIVIAPNHWTKNLCVFDVNTHLK